MQSQYECTKYVILGIVVIIQLTCTTYLLSVLIQQVKPVVYVDNVYSQNQINTNSTFKHFYEPKPNIKIISEYGATQKQTITNTISEDSLNERNDYSTTDTDESFRIVTLGDSWTFGVNVSTEENFSEQLEDLLNNKCAGSYEKFEVINLGVPGYDPQYANERYRLRGEKYKPDLLIWTLVDNDFSEITEEIFEIQKKSQHIQTNEEQRISALLNAIETFKENADPKYIEDHLMNIFRSNKHYLDKTVLFYVPESVSGKSVKKTILSKITDDLSEKHLVTSIMLSTNPKFQLEDGHPSKHGHELIAHELFAHLLGSKILTCTN